MNLKWQVQLNGQLKCRCQTILRLTVIIITIRQVKLATLCCCCFYCLFFSFWNNSFDNISEQHFKRFFRLNSRRKLLRRRRNRPRRADGSTRAARSRPTFSPSARRQLPKSAEKAAPDLHARPASDFRRDTLEICQTGAACQTDHGCFRTVHFRRLGIVARLNVGVARRGLCSHVRWLGTSRYNMTCIFECSAIYGLYFYMKKCRMYRKNIPSAWQLNWLYSKKEKNYSKWHAIIRIRMY